jgi:hypothetical protein
VGVGDGVGVAVAVGVKVTVCVGVADGVAVLTAVFDTAVGVVTVATWATTAVKTVGVGASAFDAPLAQAVATSKARMPLPSHTLEFRHQFIVYLSIAGYHSQPA